MEKENLKFVRIFAIALSVMLGALTICNLLTVMTHGIELEIPRENEFSWAIDPVDKKVLVMSEFTVKNKGAYDIEDIDIRAKVVTDRGLELLDYSEENLVVSSGTSRSFDLLIDISLENIALENWLTLLYRDSTINLVVDIDAEYMFGLISVTVDEVLDYGWSAPLSGYVPRNEAVPWLMSALGAYSLELSQEVWDVQRMAVEYLMDIDSFNFTDSGYSIDIMGSDIEGGFRSLECAITVPVEPLEGHITLRFQLHLGIVDGQAEVTVQEVSIGYARQ